MNLIVDAGNTAVKIAVFEGFEFIFKEVFVIDEALNKIEEILFKHPNIDKVITSSVSQLNEVRLKKILKEIFWLVLDCKTKVPFVNLYKTPTTLGVDRIALMSGAVTQYKNKNILVIDAGTCITYDFVNNKSEYFGGSIAPGLNLRYKSLADYTAKLPLLKPKYPPNLIGDSTNNAIHAGVCNGIIQEMNGVIEQFSNKYEELVVILTGGDAIFLSERLKSGIFVDQNFLLHGLNYILEYTIDK